MAQRFLVREGGITKQVEATAVSTGVTEAGLVPALGSDGRFDMSLMPTGLGTEAQILTASETLSAGVFVNIWSNGDEASVRLADAAIGRPADGFVKQAVTLGSAAVVYPLDVVNSEMSGLTPGSEYWLGTLGGVTETPSDETDPMNVNTVSQRLGKAKSETELITYDSGYVVL